MEDDSESRGGDAPNGPEAPTPDSLLPYDRWMEDALRGVVARALNHAVAEGIPGQHHFYITFRTTYPGVVIPARLLQKYPEEITIVLQHQYDKLYVDEVAGLFGVSLSFGGVNSALTVPFAAVSAFVDPFVQYGLRFSVAAPPAAEPPASLQQPVLSLQPGEKPPIGDLPQVVSLDAFRRKRD